MLIILKCEGLNCERTGKSTLHISNLNVYRNLSMILIEFLWGLSSSGWYPPSFLSNKHLRIVDKAEPQNIDFQRMHLQVILSDLKYYVVF